MSRSDTIPELARKGLRLRAPVQADIAARKTLGRVPEITQMFGIPLGDPKPISTAEAEGWFGSLSAQPLAWVIEEQGALIGEIRLQGHVIEDRRAEMEISILDPKKLGQGIGPRAIHLLLRHAFETMRLHRVAVRVLASNTRAIVAFRKVGFVEEGRERKSSKVGQKWQDDVIMGLLNAEYVGIGV